MFDDSHQPVWILAQLKPNGAGLADRNLRQQGYETFLPMEDRTIPRRGRFVRLRRPLFPGYIFVARGRQTSGWREVRSTRGVTGLVTFGRGPAQVPGSLISELRGRCDDDGVLLPPASFATGDRVRVSSGPFASLVAQIETLEPDHRAWVLLDVLGKQTRVSVRQDELREL